MKCLTPETLKNKSKQDLIQDVLGEVVDTGGTIDDKNREYVTELAGKIIDQYVLVMEPLEKFANQNSKTEKP